MSSRDRSEHGDIGGASRKIRHQGDVYDPTVFSGGTNGDQAGIYKGVGGYPVFAACLCLLDSVEKILTMAPALQDPQG